MIHKSFHQFGDDGIDFESPSEKDSAKQIWGQEGSSEEPSPKLTISDGVCREVEVRSLADVAQALQLGNSRRVVAAHNLNEFSSRSHAVLQVSSWDEVGWAGIDIYYLLPAIYTLAGGKHLEMINCGNRCRE